MRHAANTPAVARLTQPRAARRGRTSALTGIAAALTVLTGLLLDLAIALRFGAGHVTDAFFVAARLPVGVAMVLLGGANLVLVPAITNMIAQRRARKVCATVTSLALLTFLASSAVALLLGLTAPWVVRLLAPGLPDDVAASSARMLQVLVLVIPLTGLAELLRAMANACDTFILPTAANAVLNVVAAGFILTATGLGIEAAAWAYVIGGVARILLLLPICRRLGWRLKWKAGEAGGLRDPEAVRLLAMSVRPGASAGLAPAVRIVEQVFASFLPAGSITLLNYGYRLIFAIGGTVVFRSVLAVLTPGLARAQAAQDDQLVHKLTRSGVRTVVFLATVLTVTIGTLGVPAALIVFNRGEFARSNAQTLGLLLALLSLCLIAEGLQRALLAPFYAHLDTRNPFRNALIGAGVNIALIPVLTLPFQGSTAAIFGIAGAFVVSEYVGAFDAWLRWRKTRAAASLGLGRLMAVLVPVSVVASVVALALRNALQLDTPSSAPVGLGLTAAVGLVALMILLAGRAAVDPAYAQAFLRRRLKRPGVQA